MRSGELASAAGVSVDSLRHYERRGLLAAPRRLANGYRSYPPESLTRVLLIRRALAMGFGLSDLARILQARDRGAPPCREVRALAARKLEDVDRQIETLHAFRERLRRTLEDWDRRLVRRPEGEPAKLLESIAFPVGESAGAPSPLRGVLFGRGTRRKENR